jgi:nucleotide-binding universal stress UspA family protein
MKPVEAGRRITLKNVLFATDLSSCSNAALPCALSVARRYGATLYAAYVMPTEADMLVMSPEYWSAVAEDEDKRIQGYVEHLEKQMQGIPHDVLTPRGKVPDELARIIEERKIDLLVLGTHGRTGVRKLVLGSVAEEIFRRAACPVLSVGPNVSCQPSGETEFRHILFATDFSEESLAALPYAISLAEEDQAQLVILHVIEQPAASILDLQAVTASLMRRLHGLVPPEGQHHCPDIDSSRVPGAYCAWLIRHLSRH